MIYRFRPALSGALCLLALLLVVAGGGWKAQAQAAPPVEGTEALPPGATIETVLTDMHRPVAMAFDQQGRLFYTEKESGNVRLFANGVLQSDPVITFRVNIFNERGLLGIALDPNFSQNHYVYIYYTCSTNAPDCPVMENRVVRFVETNGVGSSPTTIFTSPQTAGQHNGGNIHFGPDGKLYISIGDNFNPPNGQDVTVKNGKMHRINSDGSMPADNPNFNTPGALPSLYAMGLRNSFDFTFDPLVPGRILASENGPGCDDELNRIEPTYNYGWRANYPCDDSKPGGPDPQFNTMPPLWTNGQGCCIAPTGITVYTGNQVPQWRDDLFMAAYEHPGLYHFYFNADRTAVTKMNLVEGVPAMMDIETGPDGALWFIDGGGYTDGILKRIVGSGGAGTAATATPPANATASPASPSATEAPNPTATPSANPPSIPGSGSRTFPETKQTVSGIFLQYWDKNGGLPQQGFPISPLINEVSDLNGKPYVVQYFERAVFEYHPENQPPYNVLLSQLGTFQYKKKYPNGAPNQQPNTSSGSVVFPETGKRLGGRFLQYWQQNGGLAQQGYPISDEFTEKNDLDGKTYRVQYFERAVFEMHPENQAPYDVLLSQLGTFRYNEKYSGR
ncbi:MAG: aldose sugar dehydrogenase [Chloroflexia bacterium]|jgi:glucose/arabinose dehydrogenase|nr:aldose sugar dehydrogenase [Chloroflexia bacterium]